MVKASVQASIDVRGKRITTYILYEAAMKLRDMGDGEVIEIITEDYEPIESDIGAWCRMTGQRLLESEKETDLCRYYIEKGVPQEKESKLALVISSPGLEELLSPLGFALAAALVGTEVHVYFQGPAVRVLKKGFKEKLGGINRPFSGFARKGLAKIGHLPPQDKLRQLRELGAHFYMCGPSMEHFRVKKTELIFDDVVLAEYLTFVEVMRKADVQIYV
ncbi:DsrE family protein [Chloroflexota bacterium]